MKEYIKPSAEVLELRVTENLANQTQADRVQLKWENAIPVSVYSALGTATSEA